MNKIPKSLLYFVISEAQVPRDSQSGVWLGLNDLSLEGKYVWSNGVTAKFTNWLFQGQPSSPRSADEDCVVMVTGNGNGEGKWMIQRCDELNHFVCQKTTS